MEHLLSRLKSLGLVSSSAKKEKSEGRRIDSASKWQKLLYLGVWCQEQLACLTIKKWELLQSCAFHWVSWLGTHAPGWSLLPPGSPGASARGCRIGVLSVPGDIQTRFSLSLTPPSSWIWKRVGGHGRSQRAWEELEEEWCKYGTQVCSLALSSALTLKTKVRGPERKHPHSLWTLSPPFPLLLFLFTFSSILTCSYFLKKDLTFLISLCSNLFMRFLLFDSLSLFYLDPFSFPLHFMTFSSILFSLSFM